MEQGHLDDKGKEIVDKGVQGLVDKHSPWHMSDRFEFVIDEELRCHHYETYYEEMKITHPLPKAYTQPTMLERIQARQLRCSSYTKE